MRILPLLMIFSVSCSSHLLKYQEEDFQEHGNYQKEIQMETLEVEEASPKSVKKITPTKPEAKKTKTAVKAKKKTVKKRVEKKKVSKKEEKTKENKITTQDKPYRPGEKVVLEMSYFGMTAGKISFEVLPILKVNKKLAYGFKIAAETLKLFEMVYKVKNQARAYISYKTGKPFSFELDVNESKKVRQARAIYDFPNKEVRYWEKLYTKDDGLKKKEEKWDLKENYQAAYSALFVMREFPFVLNKKYQMWLVHNKDKIRIDFFATKKEVIKTNLGKFNTIVIEPKVYKKGKLDEKTKIKLWLTDDNRKMIVKLEADIKIGTLRGELLTYQP